MIKFFRHIRKSLLGEGKFSKYLLYAIGEIVLVVLGILIALSINNWNETRKDNEALKEYLVKIKFNTLEDIRVLDSLATFRRQASSICKKARAVMLDKTEDQNLFVMTSAGAAFIDYYFRPNAGGYEALKNSGYFGRINNTRLDSLLSRYYGLADEISQNEISYNNFVEGQESFISTQMDRTLLLAYGFMPQDSINARATPQEEYFKVFAQYTAIPAYRNVISQCAFQFDIMLAQYDRLTQVGQGIVEEIDVLNYD